MALMTANVIKLTLPLAPSANRMWRHWKGKTVLSEEAREYKETVGWLCRQQGIEPLEGDVVLTLDVYFSRRSGDVGNRSKLCEDALQGFAYFDDKQVARLEIERFYDKKNPRIEVTVTQRNAS